MVIRVKHKDNHLKQRDNSMKKIMFSTEYGLQQAVLSGQKTQTRRVVRLPRDMQRGDLWHPEMGIDERGRVHFTFDCIDGKQRDLYPSYQPGEVVAIAQAYKEIVLTDPIFFEGMRREAGWNNKMFVEAKYMPHRIRITDIGIEPLQDISDEDCRREGIRPFGMDAVYTCYTFDGWRNGKADVCCESPRTAFKALIDKTSGHGTWQKNPWVYVYTFELVR